jgi:hypothetical protein
MSLRGGAPNLFDGIVLENGSDEFRDASRSIYPQADRRRRDEVPTRSRESPVPIPTLTTPDAGPNREEAAMADNNTQPTDAHT